MATTFARAPPSAGFGTGADAQVIVDDGQGEMLVFGPS